MRMPVYPSCNGVSIDYLEEAQVVVPPCAVVEEVEVSDEHQRDHNTPYESQQPNSWFHQTDPFWNISNTHGYPSWDVYDKEHHRYKYQGKWYVSNEH